LAWLSSTLMIARRRSRVEHTQASPDRSVCRRIASWRSFVVRCIERRESFAIETTLRSQVTFEQARLARAAGFNIEMRYLALEGFALHLERVKARADAGGHSASEATLRRIHHASLSNLRRAMEETDELWVYDNTKLGGPPRLVLETQSGRIILRADPPPAWLANFVGLGVSLP